MPKPKVLSVLADGLTRSVPAGEQIAKPSVSLFRATLSHVIGYNGILNDVAEFRRFMVYVNPENEGKRIDALWRKYDAFTGAIEYTGKAYPVFDWSGGIITPVGLVAAHPDFAPRPEKPTAETPRVDLSDVL